MKFSVLAVVAAQLGSCVRAQPQDAATDFTDAAGVDGYWENEVPEHHEVRDARKKGDRFTVGQVRNKNYQPPGAPLDMLKAYAKYNAIPPKSLRRAFKTNSKLVAQLGNQTGSVASIPANSYDSEYVIPVYIGTPGQATYLNLDTGSADLWTFSTDTYLSAQPGHVLYRPKRSTTSKLLSGMTWQIQYGDGSGANGIVYQDKVKIGNTWVNNQAVESALSVSKEMVADTFSSGLIGMAFSTINSAMPTQQKTYFENVLNNLTQPVFTADLQKGKIGAYNFGYIDKNAYKGQIYYTTSISPKFWQVNLTGYRVGQQPFVNLVWPTIVDTGTTLALAPQQIVNDYYNQIKGSSYDSSWGVMTFPCAAQLPQFVFGLGQYRGFIPGKYMNYGPIGNGRCYGGLQISTGLPFSVMGDIILKAQFIVFNGKTKSIGFANKKTV